MCYSHFQTKCGRLIMWSHKIQSLWSDHKNHINMTCVTAGTRLMLYGLFLCIVKWNNHNIGLERFWTLALSMNSVKRSVCVSLYVCVKWLFLCLSGCITSMQQININGPSMLPLPWSTHFQSEPCPEHRRKTGPSGERAGAALGSRPSRVTDVVVWSREFFSRGN